MFPSKTEKRVLAASSLIAIVVGGLAAVFKYTMLKELEFHGGVLDEDVSAVMWGTIKETVATFAEYSLVGILIIGVAPLILWRLAKKNHTTK